MSEQTIPEPWCSLAREWVPRLIACWSVDGLETPFGNLRLLGLPHKPFVDGDTLVIAFDAIAFRTKNRDAVAYMSGDSIAVGGNRISFPSPWPSIEGIPDGLRITWSEPGVVHGLLARAIGVGIEEVRLYARNAIVKLNNYPDIILRW